LLAACVQASGGCGVRALLVNVIFFECLQLLVGPFCIDRFAAQDGVLHSAAATSSEKA